MLCQVQRRSTMKIACLARGLPRLWTVTKDSDRKNQINYFFVQRYTIHGYANSSAMIMESRKHATVSSVLFPQTVPCASWPTTRDITKRTHPG